jgi:DNA-binding MarR family transcriptional regulator
MKPIDDNLLWLLKQAFHYSLRTVNDAIANHGVTTAQIGLMNQLADEPGLSGAQLARRLLITPQGVQLALTTLERSGLVERKPDPNHGRIQRAYLTEQGRKTTKSCTADALAANEQLFAVLNADERETLASLLVRIVGQGTDDVSFTLHPNAERIR